MGKNVTPVEIFDFHCTQMMDLRRGAFYCIVDPRIENRVRPKDRASRQTKKAGCPRQLPGQVGKVHLGTGRIRPAGAKEAAL